MLDKDQPRYEEIKANAEAADNICFRCSNRTGDGLFGSFCHKRFTLVKPVYGGCMTIYNNCNAENWGLNCDDFEAVLPGMENRAEKGGGE